jgi:hypothetical protein
LISFPKWNKRCCSLVSGPSDGSLEIKSFRLLSVVFVRSDGTESWGRWMKEGCWLLLSLS